MAAKKQYSLHFKIWFGFSLVNLVFIAAIAWALWQNKSMSDDTATFINIDRPIVAKLSDIRDNLNQSVQILQALALFNDVDYANRSKNLWEEKIIPSYNDLHKNIAALDESEISPTLSTLLNVDLKTLSDIKSEHDALLQRATPAGFNKVMLTTLQDITRKIMVLDDKINDAIQIQETDSNRQLYQLQAQLEQLLFIGLILLTMGIVLSIIFVLIIGNSITSPIQKMTYFMRNLANGDLNHQLELSASTEFEELSDTLNLVVASLNNLAIVSDNIAMGDHSHRVTVKSEHDRLAIAINKMLGNFDKIVEQAYAISEGNFSTDIKPRSANDKLGQALAHMTKTLRTNKKISADQHWLQEGLNQLASLLSETNEVHALSEVTLNTICHYVEAGMGAIYVYHSDDNSLRFSAGFAINERHRLEDHFPLGQGLIGQVGMERRAIIVKETKALKDFSAANIQSATSTLDSAGLYIAPLLYEKNLIGAIEINFYKPMREIDIHFLTEAIPLISGHLRSAQQQEFSNNLIQEVEKASGYKSEFLANMSHELRTPLNSLIILTKLLLNNKESNLNNDQLESLNIIHHSAEDLLYLINDILDLSKVEAGKLEIQYSDIRLESLTAMLNSQFEHVAKEKNISFNITINPGLPDKMVSDEHRLLQILRNLIGNAIKFTPVGNVVLNIKKAEYTAKMSALGMSLQNTIQFDVIDSGIGISQEQQKFIFEPFRQADGSTSRRYGGTGLGLSISLKLAKLLGGFVDVDSIENQGSTFSLYLPIMANAAEMETIKTHSEPMQSPQKTPEIKKPSTSSSSPSSDDITHLPWIVADDIPDEKFTKNKIAIVSGHLKSSFSFANILQKHAAQVEKIANLNQLKKYLEDNLSLDVWFIDNSIPVDENLITLITHKKNKPTVIFIDKNKFLPEGHNYPTLELSKDKIIPLSTIARYLKE